MKNTRSGAASIPLVKSADASVDREFKKRARQILSILDETFTISKEDFISLWAAEETKDPFAVLVATILSQSCTDKAALHAFMRLKDQIGMKPQLLSHASTRKIENAIKIAGLQRTKSRGIKLLATTIETKYGDAFPKILEQNIEAARASLTELPMVGPKTADVLLVSCTKKSTIPVDTHVSRVSKRIGLVDEKARYEEIRLGLELLFPPSSYHKIHLNLIALGRRFCLARRPRCYDCPIRNLCSYPYKTGAPKY